MVAMIKSLALVLFTQVLSVAATVYPNKVQITAIFEELATGNYTGFFSHVSDTVNWTVEGTSPLSGDYTDLETFVNDTFDVLGKLEDPNRPITLALVNVIGGGNEMFSVQELSANGYGKNGMRFDNTYAWVTQWTPEPDSKIILVRAYLDSELVTTFVDSQIHPNPPLYHYYDQRG